MQPRVAGSVQSVTSREGDVIDVERKYPNDLAERVRESWPADAYPVPDRLVTILDVACHASFLRDEERPVTARMPRHLIVVGGGYVGLEFAQAYRRFGSRVTIIEHGPQLMARETPDVSEKLQHILSGEGIQFLIGAKIVRVDGRSGKHVSLVVRTNSGEQTVAGSDILVAAGRIPNTADIGLDKTGVELDAHGFIRVNERLETTAPDVWAIGECAGSPQFTRVSKHDFRIIRDNLAGGASSTRDRLVPYCMFTDPLLAHIGLTEGDAQREGISARVARLPMSAVLRTQTTDEVKEGFMKMLVGEKDDRILGFTMVGAEAGEVVAVVQTAMLAGLPSSRLRDAVLAHPTMAEGLDPLLSSLPVPVTKGPR